MCVRECVSIRCLMSVQELESIAEKHKNHSQNHFTSFSKSSSLTSIKMNQKIISC